MPSPTQSPESPNTNHNSSNITYKYSNKKKKNIPVELKYGFSGPEYVPIHPLMEKAMKKQARVELRTRAAEYKRKKEEEDMLQHPVQELLSQSKSASKRKIKFKGKKKFVNDLKDEPLSNFHEYDLNGLPISKQHDDDCEDSSSASDQDSSDEETTKKESSLPKLSKDDSKNPPSHPERKKNS